MNYIDFLAAVHDQLRPPTYLEIGIRDGKSLSPSRARSVGIDPAYNIKHELHCDVSLHRTTSDDYFASDDAFGHFDGETVAMSFIDGMHLFEFALRDFINVERGAGWYTAIFFDDMMPRWADEAARERKTKDWTGDVYKVWLALSKHRPDLHLVPVNTSPTGLLLVLGADPASKVLGDGVDDVIGELHCDDPQPVPRWVLDREGAVDAKALLASGLFGLLRDGRESGVDETTGRQRIAEFVERELPAMRVDWSVTELQRPQPRPWPPPASVVPARVQPAARRVRRAVRRFLG